MDCIYRRLQNSCIVIALVTCAVAVASCDKKPRNNPLDPTSYYGDIRIEIAPLTLDVDWRVSGPYNGGHLFKSYTGQRSTTLEDVPVGSYRMEWTFRTYECYYRNEPNDDIDVEVLGSKEVVVFRCEYVRYENRIQIRHEPNDLDPYKWQLDGPNGYHNEGDRQVSIINTGDGVVQPGTYVLTWPEMAGYYSPAPNPVTVEFMDGDCIQFNQIYMPSGEECYVDILDIAPGAIVYEGHYWTIRWHSSFSSSVAVRIDLYKGHERVNNITVAENTGLYYGWRATSYGWGDDVDYRIRIEKIDDSGCYDESPEFQIYTPG